MPQAPRNVPPELVEHIIDFNFSDRPSLFACSLVARAWVPATRLHLFTSLNLSTARRILAFADILRTSPYIARHAREVHVPAWLSKPAPRDALAQVFQQLSEVTVIRCAGQQLQPAWYEVLGRLSSVRSLKLRATWCDLDALNGLLRAVSGVTDLFVQTRMLSGVGEISAPAARVVPLPDLERMVVFNANGLPNDFQSIILRQDLPRLESIEAQFGSEEDILLFRKFLDRGGYKALKDLHMDFTYEYLSGPTDGTDATQLLGESVRRCNLRSLGLKCDNDDFARIWAASQESLTSTDSSDFPMCMYN
ncbi:hypothetical protein EVJ58_g2969 [Rhodofomes roseus]|uniref:F-box domain-containing protein n=1 Tax=Rhodofomes roseus TaxID=34475 RepID=A0A4Y9YS59_9APHY|nr:hypothetical protein EVJ58_g2969 [Rhodofomes roseus]